MNNLFVSIIIPCRDEEKFICKCLDSIITQDYPKDKIEILVVDGMSTDRTREIIVDYIHKHTFIRLLDNPKKIVPTAMNIGIKNCSGQIIIRIDVHTRYPDNYVSKCIQYSNQYGVDNVGGVWITLPGAETTVAKAIALALSSNFGIGNALFRTGVKEPTYVDTVPFGCYKREVFNKIGLFDEDLIRNQDTEFNLRLKKAGGKILLVPDIVSFYYARETYAKLLKMYLQYGYFRVLTVKKIGKIIGFRQLIPAIFIASLTLNLLLSLFSLTFFALFLFELAFYLFVNIFVSLLISIQKKKLLFFPSLILAFIVIHSAYGYAYLKGIFHFLILKKDRVDHNRILLTR